MFNIILGIIIGFIICIGLILILVARLSDRADKGIDDFIKSFWD